MEPCAPCEVQCYTLAPRLAGRDRWQLGEIGKREPGRRAMPSYWRTYIDGQAIVSVAFVDEMWMALPWLSVARLSRIRIRKSARFAGIFLGLQGQPSPHKTFPVLKTRPSRTFLLAARCSGPESSRTTNV